MDRVTDYEMQELKIPLHLGDLLDDVARFVRRYVVLTDEQVTAGSLWIAHTHAFDAADTTPYLNVSSAASESGKSRLFEVLECLVASPWLVVGTTEATLFRHIHQARPTVLLDEADRTFGRDPKAYQGLVAVLNAGYRRGATVPRCVGEGAKTRVESFEVFCPKAFAGLGRLPDTTTSRSIPIRMRRRAKGEAIERFRRQEAVDRARPIHEALERWSAGEPLIHRLREARPMIPEALSDRAADVWEPLLAIADVAEEQWPKRARMAAISLTTERGFENDDTGILVLAHIRDVFEDAGRSDSLPTASILTALCDREDGPWAAWWGDAVAAGRTKGPASKLARLLKRFDIHPKTVRVGHETAKGYERIAFTDAWDRYVPEPLAENVTDVTEQVGLTRGVTSVTSSDGITGGWRVPGEAVERLKREMDAVEVAGEFDPPGRMAAE